MTAVPEILIPLLSAHFISDFALQSERMVRQKRKLPTFALHIGLTFAIAYLAIGDPFHWETPLVVALSHALIDLLKIRFESNRANDLAVFVIDQSLHIAVIATLVMWARPLLVLPDETLPSNDWNQKYLLLASACIATTRASGILIQKILRTILGRENLDESAPKGLPNAGRYIGYLERLLLLIFILQNQFAAAGFLVAAKSIFRFGDINGKNRKDAEYILVGTLLSFTIGIVVAIAVKTIQTVH